MPSHFCTCVFFSNIKSHYFMGVFENLSGPGMPSRFCTESSTECELSM